MKNIKCALRPVVLIQPDQFIAHVFEDRPLPSLSILWQVENSCEGIPCNRFVTIEMCLCRQIRGSPSPVITVDQTRQIQGGGVRDTGNETSRELNKEELDLGLCIPLSEKFGFKFLLAQTRCAALFLTKLISSNPLQITIRPMQRPALPWPVL